MTTTELIEKLGSLADIGIVNAKDDAETLREAAARLFELRAKADPRWSEWLILDEGFFVEVFDGDEAVMTCVKDHALSFASRIEADAWLDAGNFERIGGGCPVLRGDCDAEGMKIFFNGIG